MEIINIIENNLITILSFIGGGIGLYYKMLSNQDKHNTQIFEIKEDLKIYNLDKLNCSNKFENMRIDIEKLKSSDNNNIKEMSELRQMISELRLESKEQTRQISDQLSKMYELLLNNKKG